MAYEVTATRRRPQRFEDLCGQEFVAETLKNSIQTKQIAHSYLFAGPRGCGKTSTARILAKALNCQASGEPTSEPCGQCESCRAITNSSSLDVIEIDGASNTSVNDVRQIKDEVMFPPNNSRYKIYIIDEVHMLSTSAFNALLKTIEEPPAYVIFIFATTELQKVPATIKSRCQQYNFRLVAVERLKNLLKEASAELNIQADDEALYWIARESGGSVRDSYTLFDQVAAFSQGHITYDKIRDKLGLIGVEGLNAIFSCCAQGKSEETLNQLDSFLQSGISIEQLISNASEYLRSLLLIKNGITKESLLGQSAERYSKEVLAAWNSVQIERGLSLFLQLYRDVRYSLSPRYELELAFSRLCWLGQYVSPSEVKAAIDQAHALLVGSGAAAGKQGAVGGSGSGLATGTGTAFGASGRGVQTGFGSGTAGGFGQTSNTWGTTAGGAQNSSSFGGTGAPWQNAAQGSGNAAHFGEQGGSFGERSGTAFGGAAFGEPGTVQQPLQNQQTAQNSPSELPSGLRIFSGLREQQAGAQETVQASAQRSLQTGADYGSQTSVGQTGTSFENQTSVGQTGTSFGTPTDSANFSTGGFGGASAAFGTPSASEGEENPFYNGGALPPNKQAATESFDNDFYDDAGTPEEYSPDDDYSDAPSDEEQQNYIAESYENAQTAEQKPLTPEEVHRSTETFTAPDGNTVTLEKLFGTVVAGIAPSSPMLSSALMQTGPWHIDGNRIFTTIENEYQKNTIQAGISKIVQILNDCCRAQMQFEVTVKQPEAQSAKKEVPLQVQVLCNAFNGSVFSR